MIPKERKKLAEVEFSDRRRIQACGAEEVHSTRAPVYPPSVVGAGGPLGREKGNTLKRG